MKGSIEASTLLLRSAGAASSTIRNENGDMVLTAANGTTTIKLCLDGSVEISLGSAGPSIALRSDGIILTGPVYAPGLIIDSAPDDPGAGVGGFIDDFSTLSTWQQIAGGTVVESDPNLAIVEGKIVIAPDTAGVLLHRTKLSGTLTADLEITIKPTSMMVLSLLNFAFLHIASALLSTTDSTMMMLNASGSSPSKLLATTSGTIHLRLIAVAGDMENTTTLTANFIGGGLDETLTLTNCPIKLDEFHVILAGQNVSLGELVLTTSAENLAYVDYPVHTETPYDLISVIPLEGDAVQYDNETGGLTLHDTGSVVFSALADVMFQYIEIRSNLWGDGATIQLSDGLSLVKTSGGWDVTFNGTTQTFNISSMIFMFVGEKTVIPNTTVAHQTIRSSPVTVTITSHINTINIASVLTGVAPIIF